jgi:hypothetical protein
MASIPPEARDGLMRVWLAILGEQHPGVTWTAMPEQPKQTKSAPRLATPRELIATR